MKRSILLLTVLAVLFTVSGAFASGNTFPFPNQKWGLTDGVGLDDEYFPLLQGWFQGQLAWYIPVIGVVPYLQGIQFQPNLDLDPRFQYPRLKSAIGNGARLMYLVQNFQQGPVFSTAPGQGDYSGIWQVVYVKWKAGATVRPITSALNLPTLAEATFTFTNVVVDRPIVALGPLGGPWYPAIPGSYRLKQVIDYDPLHKWVELPVWFAYSQDLTTKQPLIEALIIPDVADPDLANVLGANVAPGLSLVDPANTQKFWVQDWTKQPPVPPFQAPITEFSDNLFSPLMLPWLFTPFQRNPAFTPVMDFTLLLRTGLPAYVVVNNPTLLKKLLPPTGSGFAFEGNPIRINAPVIESEELRFLNNMR